jgi:colanic acid/amylovoran biosynthesis glycosyltransferase
MRIAFVVNGFPAISETFILDQITGLIDRGHEVDIYASERGAEPTAHGAVSRYGLLDRARFGPSMPSGYLLRVLKGLALAPVRYWRRPLAFLRAVNVFRHGSYAASLRPLYGAVPFLGGRSYDVVHCHYGWNGVLCAVLRDMGLLRGKLVTALHGYDVSAHLRKAGEGAYRILFDRADLLLPVSDRWRRRVLELGCDEGKVRVHHMGVDPARFTFAPRRPDADGTVRIATIGRLVEKKGTEFGIRAVARLAGEGRRIEYTIVGDGVLKKSLLGLARELGIAPAVRFLGPRRRDEVAEVLARAHIVLAPSVTAADGDQEGIPVVLMEAMATGAPVVATEHSAIPELVRDGASGHLVPERDVDALAGKLADLIAHPEDWPRLGRAGRAVVEEGYNINKLNDGLVEIYERLVDDRHAV